MSLKSWWCNLIKDIPFRYNFKQFLIAIDQLVNVILCAIFLPKEKVYADETMSAHAYRWHKNKIRTWPKYIVESIFFWEKDHCRESYESERLGRQLPPEERPPQDIIMQDMKEKGE